MNNAGNSHIPGWHHIGDAYNGLWGKFFPENNDFPLGRPRQLASQQPKPQPDDRPILNPASRDIAYRQFLDRLRLDSDHRENLRKRGLSDRQISAGLYCTIDRDTRVHIEGIPTRASERGIVCPAFDKDGRVVGCQVRLDNATDNKYRWLWGYKVKSKLPNDEMPLQVRRGEGDPQHIALAEGILKPGIIADLWPGTVGIGASSGNFRACQEQLRAALQKYPGLPILIAPDKGSLLNRHVKHQLCTTIKLLQEWGYEPRILDWGQLYNKKALDLDDWLAAGGNPNTIAQMDADDFLAVADTSWLQDLRARLQGFRTKQRGPILVEATGEAQLPEAPEYKASQYEVGDRLTTWQAIAEQGRSVADTSDTGAGKSYDAGRIDPADFGCAGTYYVTTDPRNPSTETLGKENGWKTVQGRHGGLMLNERGQTRIWDGNPKHHATTAANCARPKTIAALRSLGISQADEASTICTTCPYFGGCKSGNGPYTYLYDRRNAIASPNRIAHPSAMPDPSEYDYSNDLLTFEEASQALQNLNTISVRRFDIAKFLDEAYADHRDLHAQIQPLLLELRALLGKRKAPGRHGWTHWQIVEILKPLVPDDPDFDAIAQITGPIDDILNPSKEHGVELADLPRYLRKRLLARDADSAARLEQEGIQQFVIPLLSILSGGRGTLSIQGGRLQISQGDSYLATIARAAKCNILLDATGNRDELAALLGVEPDAIAQVEQRSKPVPNLNVTQIVGLGRMGVSRGGDQARRVNALIDELRSRHSNPGVIDFKRHARGKNNEGHWFVDSRGRNDFENCDALIFVGTPCPNLNALVAEFEAIYKYVPTDETVEVARSMLATNAPESKQYQLRGIESADPKFAEFVRQRILAEIRQGIGRIRANRRPGETLHVYIVSDYAIDLPLEVIRAEEITLDAAKKSDRNLVGILKAAVEIRERGAKITSNALGKAIGRSEQAVRKIASKFGGMEAYGQALLSVVSAYKSKVAAGDQATWDWIANEYLPLFGAEGGDEGLLEEVAIEIETHGWDGWQRIADSFSADVRKQVLAAFLRFMPQAWLDELMGGVQPLDQPLDFAVCGRGVP